MLYSTTINAESEYGITSARQAYNATFPLEIEISPAVQATAEGTEEIPAVIGINPAILQTNEAYLDFVLQSAITSWCKQYAPVVVTPPPDVIVGGIPQVISRGQGRRQLKIDNLLAIVEGYIASLPSDDDVRMAYEDANDWYRTSPSVVGMMQMLGKSDADIDQMFISASQIVL